MTSLTHAQFKVGVILSQSGQAATTGQPQARAIQLFRELNVHKSSIIEILVREDGSFPQETLEQAQDLIENEGVIALVCCSSATSFKAIVSYIETKSILTLSPENLPQTSPWIFSTRPSLQRLLQSVLLYLSAQGQQSIGVMTPETLQPELESALNLLISPGGIRLNVLQAYPLNSTVLTPEALWVATRAPETVLVWGTARDSVLAYQALRERGYERNILLNPALLSNLNLYEVEGASFILSPLQVINTLGDTHPGYLQGLRYASDMKAAPMEAAYLYDALTLIQAALEQVYTFGIPQDNLPALRFALRDALVGLGPVSGVAATYDYSENDAVGIMPRSLVMSRVNQGKLVFVP